MRGRKMRLSPARRFLKIIKNILFRLKLGIVVRKIIESGIVDKIHVFLERFETMEFRKFYDEHREDFRYVRDILHDDLSKKVYEAVIRYRYTGRRKEIQNYNFRQQYFQADIFPRLSGEAFIDGGAWIGDVVESLLKHGGNYQRIYAWEPDKENIKELNRVMENILM